MTLAAVDASALAPLAGLALFWAGFATGWWFHAREARHRRRLEEVRRRRARRRGLEDLWPDP